MKRYVKANSQGTYYVAYKNYGSSAYFTETDSEGLEEIESEYDYVDSVHKKSGLVKVSYYDEDISLSILDKFKSLSELDRAWKQYFEEKVQPQLDEDGEAECYLFFDYYYFFIDEVEVSNASEYVDYCHNIIEETYVDGDSFANIVIIENGNIALSGENGINIV